MRLSKVLRPTLGCEEEGRRNTIAAKLCSLLNYIPSLHFKIPQCSAVNYDIRKREKANLRVGDD